MNKMRYRGTPCQFFFDVTTFLNRIQFYFEMELNSLPIDQYLIKMIIEAFYPSPDLQICLTSARLRHRKGSECQTQLMNLLQTKVATNSCFFWYFCRILPSARCFWQVPDSRLQASLAIARFKWIFLLTCVYVPDTTEENGWQQHDVLWDFHPILQMQD